MLVTVTVDKDIMCVCSTAVIVTVKGSCCTEELNTTYHFSKLRIEGSVHIVDII